MLTVGVAVMVRDKYAVRLATEQREELQHLIRVGKCSARVIARARILLKSDDGWASPQVAEALDVALGTVYRIKRRLLPVTTSRPWALTSAAPMGIPPSVAPVRASSSAVLMNLSLRVSAGVHIWVGKVIEQCADQPSPRSVAHPELFPDPDSHLHHGLELPQFRFQVWFVWEIIRIEL